MKVVTVFGLSAMLVLASCGKHQDSPTAPPSLPTATVRVQTVESNTHIATEEVVGTVRARLRVVIEAKVSGHIIEMWVVRGQAVKAGDSLVQLDARENQARLDQALAQRDQARGDLRRFTTLVEQNAATRQEFDAVQARQRVAKAAVIEAETMLSHARLTAPFDGVITRKLADVGDLAAPGQPVLEMQDPTALRFEADVPEALIVRVHPGAKLAVRIPAVEQELTGTVSEISPVADLHSRTVLVKLDLAPTADLRTGQFGRVAVPLAERTTLRIPASAVTQRGQLEIVFAVADQKAHLRLVRTGIRIGTEIELVSGVSAGEQVVTDGAAILVDGQPVEVRP